MTFDKFRGGLLISFGGNTTAKRNGRVHLDVEWGMLLLDTTFYLLHLHLHVVDIIIIIIRAWYSLFHIQEGAGGRRVFLVFCVVLLLVLWCWNVFNDTTTFSLHGREAKVRFYHSHSRRYPTPPQVSPGEKRTQGKTNRCNLTWKPSQDSPRLAQPSPPPALPLLTRHDVSVVPRTYSSWLVLSNALVY